MQILPRKRELGDKIYLARLHPRIAPKEAYSSESTLETYSDRVSEFCNDANRTFVHQIYSEIVSKVVSQKNGRGCSVAELEKMCRDDCAF